MSGPILRNRVMEYVLDETPPEVPYVDPYGPFGQCWKNRRIVTDTGEVLTPQCKNPAMDEDLGLCEDCLAELGAGQ